MAENKKSFILYCDLIHTIEKMPPEKAGELFVHILKYVNDLEPVTEDLIVNLTFEPIKQQLKRDLKKWDNFIEKQRVNGALGGRPPKEKETQTIPNNPSVILENPTEPKKADSVTVTVSDTVNEKKINIPTETDFLNYCKELMKDKYQSYEFSLQAKYAAWVSDGWKDGNNAKIKNWKTKIANTIPFLKPISFKQPESKMHR